MKRYAKVIAILLLTLTIAFALFACINPDENLKGTMTLVVLDGDNAQEYSVDLANLRSGKLVAVLNYLQLNDTFVYTAYDSGYGAYLTQVNGLKEGGGNYIYLYTDIEADFDVTQYATQITYKDKTLTNSGVGVSQMSVKDGCTIIITLIKFG